MSGCAWRSPGATSAATGSSRFSWETDNSGRHVVHTGGDYDSYLQIPVIPPRRKVGGYLAR